MPKVELEYVCKKCRSRYPATVDYSGKVEDIELDDNRSRCPFCGQWNCADPEALISAVKEGGRGGPD